MQNIHNKPNLSNAKTEQQHFCPTKFKIFTKSISSRAVLLWSSKSMSSKNYVLGLCHWSTVCPSLVYVRGQQPFEQLGPNCYGSVCPWPRYKIIFRWATKKFKSLCILESLCQKKLESSPKMYTSSAKSDNQFLLVRL